MPRIAFSGVLQRHLPAPACVAAGDTVRDALRHVFDQNPHLESYLLDDQGRVRKHVAIYVNDRPLADRRRQGDRLSERDEIFVFQALSGG